jgi:uncharacterized membrane protein
MNISGQQGTLTGQINRFFKFPDSPVKTFFLILLSVFFTYAGIDHLVSPNFYVSIMPPWIPWHLELVYISGVCEIIGGIGVLVPRFRAAAGAGLVALLIAVYPANLHMAFNPHLFPQFPLAALYIRLVLQFFAFYWAWKVTRP